MSHQKTTGAPTRARLLPGIPVVCALALIPSLAAGQALSSDIELLHPKPSPGALPGLESSDRDEPGTLRAQATMQFEDSPLVLYSDDGEVGAVVHRRITTHLGFGATLAKRWRVGGSLPMHGQWGSEVPSLAADGFGVGDIRVGASYWIGRSTLGDLTAHLGFALPFGQRNAWMGDQGPRTEIRLAYATGVRRVGIHANLGLDARAAWHTDANLYDRGSAVLIDGGLAAPVVGDLDLFGAVYTRWGGGIFLRRPDFVLTAMAGARYHINDRLDVNLGLGRGFTPGVGTTDMRVLAQLNWHRPPPPDVEPEPEEFIVVVQPDVPEPPPPEPPPEPEEPPPAQVVGEQVIVTVPIQFFVDTATLMPESQPAMEAIASLMADDPRIGHLVIEGHASAEGTFEYNYDLSARRARAIHEALLEEGVHKSRISYRGMGEVEPLLPGDSEEALARNRRVEFHIINRRDAGDGNFEHPEKSPLPWSGELVDTPRPLWPQEVLDKYEADQAKIQKALGPVIEDDKEDAFSFEDPEMQGPVRVQRPPEAIEEKPPPSPEPTSPVTAPAPKPPSPAPPAPQPEPADAPSTNGDASATDDSPPTDDAVAGVVPTVTTPASEPDSDDGIGPAHPYAIKVYAGFIPKFLPQADKLREAGRLPEKRYSLTLEATLDRTGRLIAVRVTRSSGAESLDGAAVRAFYQSQPFPTPPSDVVADDGRVRLSDIRLEVEGSNVSGSPIDVPSGDRLEEMLKQDGGAR